MFEDAPTTLSISLAKAAVAILAYCHSFGFLIYTVDEPSRIQNKANSDVQQI